MPVLKVLIADDHEIVRQGLRSMLEAQRDCQVVGEAGDGRQAVTLTKELNPDVVILDIGMPTLNGLEATRQILKMRPQTKVLDPDDARIRFRDPRGSRRRSARIHSEDGRRARSRYCRGFAAP